MVYNDLGSRRWRLSHSENPKNSTGLPTRMNLLPQGSATQETASFRPASALGAAPIGCFAAPNYVGESSTVVLRDPDRGCFAENPAERYSNSSIPVELPAKMC